MKKIWSEPTVDWEEKVLEIWNSDSQVTGLQKLFSFIHQETKNSYRSGFIDGVKTQSPHSPECVCDKCVLIREEVDECRCRCHSLPEDLRKSHLCTCPKESRDQR